MSQDIRALLWGMKIAFKLGLTALLVSGLTACQTIDEERFANVECKDLKQLVATENLASLSQPEGSGMYRTANDRENRDRLFNIFDELDDDTKRNAELRAAYRNNCR